MLQSSDDSVMLVLSGMKSSSLKLNDPDPVSSRMSAAVYDVKEPEAPYASVLPEELSVMVIDGLMPQSFSDSVMLALKGRNSSSDQLIEVSTVTYASKSPVPERVADTS